MNREAAMKSMLRISAPVCLALAWLAGPAGAQQFHDATAGPGPSLSSIAGGAFSPAASLAPAQGGSTGAGGAVVAMSPATAVAIAAAGICVTERLGARALSSAVSGEPIASAAQLLVRGVLTGTRPASELAAVLAGGGAEGPAAALAEALEGLAAVPDAGMLVAAIGHFNALVAGSTAAFLTQPPAELLAVHAVLGQLGLRTQCSPLPRIEVCVVTPENMLTSVQAIIQPSTGDTLVDDVRLSELHSTSQPQYAAGRDWFAQGLPVEFQGRSYVKSLSRRVIPREALVRLGVYRGVAIFAPAEARAPYSDLYLPAGPGCDFQSYVATTGERPIEACAVSPAGELVRVDAAFRPLTGDTVIGGRPLRELRREVQPQYALGHDWFVEGLPIDFHGVEFIKVGLPTVMRPDRLRRVGEHRGVPAFAATGSADAPDELYLPLGPTCEFQPYVPRGSLRARG